MFWIFVSMFSVFISMFWGYVFWHHYKALYENVLPSTKSGYLIISRWVTLQMFWLSTMKVLKKRAAEPMDLSHLLV